MVYAVDFDRKKDLQSERFSVAQRFAQMALDHPQSIAVKSGHDSLTYLHLDKEANKVANHILALNHTGSNHIAILLGHDWRNIQAIIGILKAGKVYIPLNPDKTAKNLTWILTHSKADILITVNEFQSLAQKICAGKIPILTIDCLEDEKQTQNPDVQINSDDPAYLIYTSGSSSKPKGVIQSHRSILRVASVQGSQLNITPEDKIAQIAACSYTMSVIDIFSALLNGACLSLFDIKKTGLAQMSEWFQSQRINVCQMIPSLFHLWCRSFSPGFSLPDLRAIKLGGEPAFSVHFESFQKHFSERCKLINGYGSSEILLVSQFITTGKYLLAGSHIPVGNPCPGIEILLLDPDGGPVGLGQTGEIHIRSKYLPHGYWTDVDGSSERFYIDPEDPEKMRFRTGDLGKMKAGGELIYLGRRGHQMKVNGVWVDLSELEAKIISHPAVKEAMVKPISVYRTGPSLAAQVVTAGESKITAKDLIEFLQPDWPHAAGSTSFEFVKSLPRMESGKIDRGIRTQPVVAGLEWVSIQSMLDEKPEIDTDACWLVLGSRDGTCGKFLLKFKQIIPNPIFVEPGKIFSRIQPNHYTIRPGCPKNFDSLLCKVLDGTLKKVNIIYTWSFLYDGYCTQKHHGGHIPWDTHFYGLTYLGRALRKIRHYGEINLMVLTGPLFRINGEETIRPERALVTGPVLAMSRELPGIFCRCIDLNPEDLNSSGEPFPVDRLIALFSVFSFPPNLAFRRGTFFRQKLENIDLSETGAPTLTLKESDVCVITGGLGGMGLELARFITWEFRAKLVLIGRTAFPNRKHWARILKSANSNPLMRQQIRALMKIENRGRKVEIVKVDLGKRKKLKKVLQRIEKKYSRITGIIHAAGIPASGPMHRLERKDCQKVFLPKVQGLLNILQAPRSKPRFFLLCSSLSVLRSESGMADYVSANAFMDAVARENWQNNGQYITSINWDSWDKVGMRREIAGGRFKGAGKNQGEKSLTISTAITAFHQILSSPRSQWIVTNNKDCLAEYAMGMQGSQEKKSFLPEPPNNGLEVTILNCWEKWFAHHPMGVADNFFESGGDSLIAAGIASELGTLFKTNISPDFLIKSPTVAGQAKFLKNANHSPQWKYLIPIKPQGQKTPFFCVHNRKGQVWGIAGLRSYLQKDRPLYGIQARGVAGGDPPFDCIETMAREYLIEVERIQKKGPFIIGGRCFGGMVAFEMAHQLLLRGKGDVFLVVLDGSAPIPEKDTGESPLASQKFILKSRPLTHLNGGYTRYFYHPIFNIPVDSINVVFSSEQARAKYRGKPFPGTIVVITYHNPSLPDYHCRRIESWGKLAAGQFYSHTLNFIRKGDMLKSPYVETVARILDSYFEKIDG